MVGLLGFAGRDMDSRGPKGLSNRQLGMLGFAMLATAGAILLVVNGGSHVPSGMALMHLAGGTVFGTLGYHALTYAMRTGEVSAVTPFRYTRLVFAMVLAMALFGERPDLATWIGAALVVGFGHLRANPQVGWAISPTLRMDHAPISSACRTITSACRMLAMSTSRPL